MSKANSTKIQSGTVINNVIPGIIAMYLKPMMRASAIPINKATSEHAYKIAKKMMTEEVLPSILPVTDKRFTNYNWTTDSKNYLKDNQIITLINIAWSNYAEDYIHRFQKSQALWNGIYLSF